MGWYNTLKLFLETPWQKAEIRDFSNDLCKLLRRDKKEDLWAFLSARIVVYNVMPKTKKTHTHILYCDFYGVDFVAKYESMLLVFVSGKLSD